MSKNKAYLEQPAQRKVIQDEQDAEARYIAAITQAQQRADDLARNERYTESQRVAAEQAAATLRRIEYARQAAAKQPTPEAAKLTWQEELRKWWGGG